jgi:hypothetical protein
MTEFFYGYPSGLVALAIFALMALAMEAGFRSGRRGQARTSAASKSQIETLQASLLGVLALMLGFTFSIALNRYNSRSEAVVHEANAIGTAYLRTGLLPDVLRGEARALFAAYADTRARAVTLTWATRDQRGPLSEEARRLQGRLWEQAATASRLAPSPATTGLYVQALNEMIDAHASIIAEVDRHVPELVLLLLFGAFVVAGGIIGYSAGLTGNRPSRATFVMVGLVVLLMFMILDLDRPRRGIIQVNTQSLLETTSSIVAETLREP